MATHYSVLAWRLPWTEEPSGLQSKGSQTVGPDGAHVRAHTDRQTDMDADLARDGKGLYLAFTSQPLPVFGIVP